jgi:hypothetical protein
MRPADQNARPGQASSEKREWHYHDYDYDFVESFENAGGWRRIQQRISSFLCFCAGADPQILRRCPHSERVKEQGVGGVVLATATLAFCSGFYAFYTVFSPKEGFALSEVQQASHMPAVLMALVFGMLWSLMIFNLDRFIVSSAGHGDGTEKITKDEIVTAIPRIIMAIMIGLVLSKPLEIRIMKTEIDARLTEIQKDYAASLQKRDDLEYQNTRKELDDKKDALQKRLATMQGEIATLRDKITTQRDKVDAEADGSASGRAGEGAAFHAKKQNLDEMKAQYESTTTAYATDIKSLGSDIAELQVQIDREVAKRQENFRINEKKAASQDGLMKRIQIAEEIAPVASWMLTILLIVLEIAPIFFKMMLTIGPYDYFCENVKRLAIASRGIELKQQLDGKESVELKDAVYYQADTLLEHETGKLMVERELTRIAQQEFRNRVAEDIQNQPEKYMSDTDNPLRAVG